MIEPRIGPSGARVYRARVYYRGRYVASRTFPRKRDAQEWERKQAETLKTGAWADPKAGEKPVREWCEIWLSAQPARAQATERKFVVSSEGRSPEHLAGVRSCLSVVRGPGVGGRYLAKAVSSDSSPNSLGVLRRVFDRRHRVMALSTEPAGIRLPKAQGNDPRPLTHDELWRLADQLSEPRDRLLVLVAGYCGLRWGELAALRWTDVDSSSGRRFGSPGHTRRKRLAVTSRR